MRALLLSAGLGTRLGPVTEVLPKCLAPVCGRPLLRYWLHMLDAADAPRIVVNLHHHQALVREYLAQPHYAGRVSAVHEPVLLGTGGTLLANRALLSGGPVLVAHADNLSVFDLHAFVQSHARRPRECMGTMMLFESPDPRSCGIVELDQRGTVQRFHEKSSDPPGNLANGAVYLFEPEIFDLLAGVGGPFIDLSTQIVPRLLGRIHTFRNDILHRDIGTMASLAAAQFELPMRVPQHPVLNEPLEQAWERLLDQGSPPLRVRLACAFSRAMAPAA